MLKNNSFYIWLAIGSVFVQFIAVYYGVRISRVVKVAIWSTAWWWMFTGSMLLVSIRRSIAVYRYIDDCPVNSHNALLVENAILFILSILWMLFVMEMTKLFSRYFEGGKLKELIKGDPGEKGEAGEHGSQGVQGPPGRTNYVKLGNGNGGNGNNK